MISNPSYRCPITDRRQEVIHRSSFFVRMMIETSGAISSSLRQSEHFAVVLERQHQWFLPPPLGLPEKSNQIPIACRLRDLFQGDYLKGGLFTEIAEHRLRIEIEMGICQLIVVNRKRPDLAKTRDLDIHQSLVVEIATDTFQELDRVPGVFEHLNHSNEVETHEI